MKASHVITAVCLLAVIAPLNEAQAQPARGLAGFEDRTPLLENPAGLIAAIEDVRQQADSLPAAARAHAESRRQDLTAATGQEVTEFSEYRDLVRFPQANRGHPVELRGEVTQIDKVPLGDRTATLIEVVPHDSVGGTVAVLTGFAANGPQVGGDVRFVGIFLKLAELPGGAVAPLLVAGEVAVETSMTGLLPDPSLWSIVEHRTRGVRPSEGHLYYRLLRQAGTVDLAALRIAALEHVTRRRDADPKLRDREPFPVFVDLFQNPELYEGQAVTLSGYAREIRTYPAGENSEGIERLYEAWVYTDDSQSNPAIVIAASASPDLPIGDDLQVPVRATGYFLKIYGYRAKDTTRVAPMILAGKIELLSEPELAGAPPWLLGLVGLLCAAIIFWIVVSYVGIRRRRSQVNQPPPDFSTLEGQSFEDQGT